MKTGIELIAQERQEQIEKHGRTVERDVQENNFGELNQGARALMYPIDDVERVMNYMPLREWDNEICLKMASKPYKERLIIAGALIAAEIDRIQYESDNE